MKVRIKQIRTPRVFNGAILPSFTDKVQYVVRYKFHWWQKYRTIKDRFGNPRLFGSEKEINEYFINIGFERGL